MLLFEQCNIRFVTNYETFYKSVKFFSFLVVTTSSWSPNTNTMATCSSVTNSLPFSNGIVRLYRNTLPFSNGIVRLYRNGVTSSSYYYGIVQIWYNGQWGNICDDDDYDQYEADVICHQLGYTGASSYSRAGLVRLVYILSQV